jgi:hypothetical protein
MRKVQIYPHQLEAGSNLNVSFMRIQTFFVHLVMQGDCPFLCEGGWSLNFSEAIASFIKQFTWSPYFPPPFNFLVHSF